MSPDEYIQKTKEKYGNQRSRDGVLISEMDNKELLKKMIDRYPDDRNQIAGLDTYLNEGEIKPFPETDVQKRISSVSKPFFGSIGGALKSFGAGIKDAYGDLKEETEETLQKEKSGEMGGIRSFVHRAGEGGAFVGDAIFEGVKLLTPQGVEEPVKKAVEAIGDTDIAKQALAGYESIKEKYPNAVGIAEDVFNIASVLPSLKGVQAGANITVKGATKAIDIAGDASKGVSNTLGDMAKKRSENIAIKQKADIDSVVERIIQSKARDPRQAGRDLELAKKAFEEVDLAEVKSFEDLSQTLSSRATALKTKMDELLELEDAGKVPLTSKELTKTVQVGDEIVSQDFVRSALEQLDEMYDAIKDPVSRAKIKALKGKYETDGLTRKELNDLAREYGTEFKTKAFGKTGESLTSTNAQAFENTRKGVKEAVRGTIEGDLPKEIDSKITALLNTSRLSQRMERKVSELTNRVKPRGLAEKIARKTADAVDIMTLHTVSGFLSRLLPSNVGLKTMNALDIEAELTKNIKKLDKILSAKNDKDMISEILKVTKESVDNPSMGLSLKDVSRDRIRALAKNMSGEDYVALESYIEKVGHRQTPTMQEIEQAYTILEAMGVKPMARTDEAVEATIKNLLGDFEQGMRKVPVTSE